MIDATRELSKTVVIVAAALVLAAMALLTQPRIGKATVDQAEIGERFFPELTADAIKGLALVEYNETLGKADEFRVQQAEGGWVLPQKFNYPADAKEAVAKGTAWLLSVKRDALITEDQKVQAEYSLLDPEDVKSSQGYGTLFRVLDSNQNPIASLIVGKEVEGKTTTRYVREPKSDKIYRADVGEYGVSTRFRDWIEKDLLELSESIRSSPGSFDSSSSKKTFDLLTWTDYKLDLRVLPAKVSGKDATTLHFKSKDGEASPEGELQGLSDKQETNQDKVRDTVDALKNLQIVDVFPKPPGLKPDLTVEDGQELAQEMAIVRGFYVAASGRDVVPTDGELLVETKEGLTYKLRFGKLDRAAVAEKPAAKDAKKEAVDAKPENRFLLVTVAFNEAKFPPIADPEAPKPEPAKPGEKKDPEAEKKALETKKKSLEAAVASKRATREKDIENGKKRAQELQERYDKWYYLVANDTYKKIKLDRTALAKAKEVKKDAADGLPPIIPHEQIVTPPPPKPTMTAPPAEVKKTPPAPPAKGEPKPPTTAPKKAEAPPAKAAAPTAPPKTDPKPPVAPPMTEAKPPAAAAKKSDPAPAAKGASPPPADKASPPKKAP